MMTTKNLTIPSRLALAGLYEHQYRGYPVYANLLGSTSYAGILILSVGGKKFTKEETEILDDFAVANMMADPRIWPPKLVRIASCYGNFSLGMAAAFLSLSKRIGPRTTLDVAKTLLALQKEVDKQNAQNDEDIRRIIREYINNRKFIPGFGLIGRPTDERLAAFSKKIYEKKLNAKKFWHLGELYGEVVQKERGLVPNIVLGGAAFLLDFDLSAEQTDQAFILLFTPPFAGNASEGAEQAPEVLQCLPIEAIADKTPALRKSPRALGTE